LPLDLSFPIRNPQSAIRNPQSAIRNPQSAIRNPQSAIRNPQSAIRNQIYPPTLAVERKKGRAKKKR
jgi:major type 1 subunit fimbrin (pilin)